MLSSGGPTSGDEHRSTDVTEDALGERIGVRLGAHDCTVGAILRSGFSPISTQAKWVTAEPGVVVHSGVLRSSCPRGGLPCRRMPTCTKSWRRRTAAIPLRS